MKRWTVEWWLELIIILREIKEYEFSDGIKEMLENDGGYKISFNKDKSIFVKK
jgi:hypothetical protein